MADDRELDNFEGSDEDFGDFGDLEDLEGLLEEEEGEQEESGEPEEIDESDLDLEIPLEEEEVDPEISENPEDYSKLDSSGIFDLDGASEEDILDFDVDESSDNEFDDIQLPVDSTKSEEQLDLDDIDAEIAELTRELEENGAKTGTNVEDLEEILSTRQKTVVDDDSHTADDNGTVIDENFLLDEEEDNYAVVSRDADFISDTGEIVVMNNTDDENNFKLVYVDIENIAIVKRIRASNNVEDLVKSIKSTGLLKPVDVANTSAEGVYVLLDGYRRILACARAGKRRIPCVVNTRVSVPEIPILEAMYNHSKKYTIQEMIDYIDYLEKQKGIMSASMIEYLLQMNSGDYTKLKDILNDDDEDIVSKLKMGQYTIDMAFKKLEQRRKKESAEEKDLKRATKVYEEERGSGIENVAEQGETGDESVALSDDEIKQLAVSAGDLDNLEDESLEGLIEAGENIEGFKPHKQDPKYRERLDPTLRKSVLARDNNTCRICKIASGMEFVETLDVHHIQEVYLGGSDDIDNLITACTVCHKLIHMHGRGELHMRPISEFSESEQLRFKKIIKLGNKIRMDMKMKGMKVDQLKKLDNTSTIGRTKPGTGQEAG